MNENPYRSARKSAPMTQEHLARAAGIDVRTLRKLESGTPVSPETILAVRSVLGMGPEPSAVEAPSRPHLEFRPARLEGFDTVATRILLRLLQASFAIGVAQVVAVPFEWSSFPGAMSGCLLPLLVVVSRRMEEGRPKRHQTVYGRRDLCVMLFFGALIQTIASGMSASVLPGGPGLVATTFSTIHAIGAAIMLLASAAIALGVGGGSGVGETLTGMLRGIPRIASSWRASVSSTFLGAPSIHASSIDGNRRNPD